jgi:glutathione-independent formaldehyde dehydrogenase
MATGQANVKAYSAIYVTLSTRTGEPVVHNSHKLPLEGAPDAYEHFDARDPGWTKVVLKPAAYR